MRFFAINACSFHYRHLAAVAIFALTAGCTALAPVARPVHDPAGAAAAAAAAPTAGNCLHWYGAQDMAIRQGGTADAGSARLTGFPQLRADRFASSFRDFFAAPAGSADTGAARAALLDYLRALDTEARVVEIANLPAGTRAPLQPGSTAELRELLDACGLAITRENLATPDQLTALAKTLRVSDHYAGWKRTLGLYPLTSIPFFAGVSAWQRETAQRFAQVAATVPHELAAATRYLPMTQEQDIAQNAPGEAVRRYAVAARNALGIPQLAAQDWAALLAQYAPVYDIEIRGDTGRPSDRFGALRFSGGAGSTRDAVDIAEAPEVDISSPVAYRRIAFTRFRGTTLTQLVYTIWFPERPAGQLIDLLAGHLDGVMLRITLDAHGIPLLADSIHACGCYHLFFPTRRLIPRTAPRPDIEWAFVPATLQQMSAGQRLQVRLAPSTHYLIDIRPFVVAPGAPQAADMTYALRDDNELRSLPTTGAAHKSIFGRDGIVRGSERGERFLFWPMGVASPGAMRQWGTHATAFVGRRHFDDADLIEQRFEISAFETDVAKPAAMP